MITVAVTGGIGSGKSTVSTVLREHGAVVVDSDRLAREVVAPDSPGLAAIGAAFGPSMLTAADDAIVVNDIPLLTTLAAAASFHLVIGVRADAEVRVNRLVARGLSGSD